MTRTKSTESPRIETACFCDVPPETADNQNEWNLHVIENKEENGGRGKDRTCDPSRVKGIQAVDFVCKAQKSTDFPTIRDELRAWIKRQTDQTIICNALILIRSLDNYLKHPSDALLKQIAANTASLSARVGR